MRGKNNPNWKDDVKNLSVCQIHVRIEKVKPKPVDGKCAYCHKVEDKKGIIELELSNIKNHNYTLNPDDYQWAHHSCQIIYDWTPERRKKQSEMMKKNNPLKRPEIIEKAKKTRRKNRAKSNKNKKPKSKKDTSQVGYWLS